MRIYKSPSAVTLWLSARDTYEWAHRPGNWWPASQLSGRSLVASFDSDGLYDMKVNGGRGEQDISATEFNAITSDFLRDKLAKDHPAWFVTVGQFGKGE